MACAFNPMTDAIDVLAALQEDLYRWGDLQAVRYDKARTDLFPSGYLGKLYNLCKGSARRSGNGVLDITFSGNPPSDFDSIVSFLAHQQLVILGQWQEDGTFKEFGFAFSIISCGFANTERSLFAGYCFFRHSWGSEEQTVLTMLGLAYLFKEFDLQAIHGIRFRENLLTAKFMAKFGFKQVGEIPYYQVKGTKLVPGVVSTLLRTDFEEYVKAFLLAEYRAGQVVEPEPESVAAPAEDKPDEQPYLPLNWI
jgi:RimJ/RimL family protein N-acetyltransferase